MEQTLALEEFLRSLRVSFNTASLYSKDHPYFIKSVEEFKNKIDNLILSLSPIKIGITVSSLILGGKTWDKVGIYDEIAKMLHYRKLKSIEIKEGVTIEELVCFLTAVSLRPKEIFRSGGVGKIMRDAGVVNIAVGELDYSSLLGGEGEELKDIWVYLLQGALQEQDQDKIDQITDNFPRDISRFKAEDFLQDNQLRENIVKLLGYLKGSDREKFRKCLKELCIAILKDKNFSGYDNLDKIKKLLHDLDGDTIADIVLDQSDDIGGFDVLNFQLFSQLIDEEKHILAAGSMKDKLEKSQALKNNPKIIKKLRELLSLSGQAYISDIYRNTLVSFLRNISSNSALYFDRNLININYHSVLLNLLSGEDSPERLDYVFDSLLSEWDRIAENSDWQYLRNLLDVLNKKREGQIGLNPHFEELYRQISDFVDKKILADDPPADIVYFIDSLQETAQSCDYYLSKIFYERKVNPYILRLFFKFFSNQKEDFYKELGQIHSDVEFLNEIVDNIRLSEYPLAAEIYKYIYSISGESTQLEVLKAMQSQQDYDSVFLFSILNKGDAFLKKEALLVLIKHDTDKKRVLDTLLGISSPLGLKNKLILQNLEIVEEVALDYAYEYLLILAKRRFPWNRNLRVKARSLLERCNVREN